MPASAPSVSVAVAEGLAALGARIRERRKHLKINAVATAEAAGMSRVTLHRIERGEPSVTMGAYMSVAAALGLDLQLADPGNRSMPSESPLPKRIRVADFPELKRLAWQTGHAVQLTPRQALEVYERNWRHVDRSAMSDREVELLRRLQELAGGRLLV